MKRIIFVFALMFAFLSVVFSQDGVTSATSYEDLLQESTVKDDVVEDRTSDVKVSEETRKKTESTATSAPVSEKKTQEVERTTVVSDTTGDKTAVSKVENEKQKTEQPVVTPTVLDGAVVIDGSGTSGDVKTSNKVVASDRGRIGNLILFEPDEKKNILPADDLEKNENSYKLKTDYELDDFLPKTLTDFYLAKPAILKDMNGIVVEGRMKIKDSLGIMAYNAGYKNIASGRISLAIEIFEKLIHYNFSVTSAEYALAVCYYAIGDYNNVIKYVSRMILKTNDNDSLSKANELLGEVYFLTERYTDSSASFIRGVMGKDGKRDGLLLFKAGLASYKAKDSKSAIGYWEQSEKLGNQDAAKNLNWLRNR